MRRIGLLLLAGIVPAAGQAPSIAPNGVVNAADYTSNFAPGTMIAISGSHLAARTAANTAMPVSGSLEGVTVEVREAGGVWTAAPVYFVSEGQVDVQLPFLNATQLRVRNAGGTSAAAAVTLAPRAPRIFTRTMDGRGEPILFRAGGYSWVSAAAPAAAGENLVLLLTGLGAVAPAKAAGAAGGDNGANGPRNAVADPVFVSFGGVEVAATFAGLMPGAAGVYQVEFQVPEGVPAGLQNLRVRVGAVNSQANVAAYASERQQVNVGPAGGEVAGPNGLRLQFPEGAVAGTVGIGLSPLSENSLSAALRAALAEMKLTFAFGFRLAAGVRFAAPVTATAPNETGFRVGMGVLVAEGRPESDGEPMLIDAVQVSGDTMTSSASGFPGVRGAGDYVFAVPQAPDGVTDVVHITGQVTLDGQPTAGILVGALDSPFVSLTDGSGTYIVYSGVGVSQLPRNVLLVAQSVGAVNVATAGERTAVVELRPVFGSQSAGLGTGGLNWPTPGFTPPTKQVPSTVLQRDDREERKYSAVRETARQLCTACKTAAGQAQVNLMNKISSGISDVRDQLLDGLRPQLCAFFQEPLKLGVNQTRTFTSYPLIWPGVKFGPPTTGLVCPGSIEFSPGSLTVFPRLEETGDPGDDPVRVTALDGLPPAPAEVAAGPTVTSDGPSLQVDLRGIRGGFGTLNGEAPVKKIGFDQRWTFSIPLGGLAIECPQELPSPPSVKITNPDGAAPVSVNALVEVSDCDTGEGSLTGLWMIPASSWPVTCSVNGYHAWCEPYVYTQQIPGNQLYPVPFMMQVCQKGNELTGHQIEPGVQIDFAGSVAGSGAARRVSFRLDAVADWFRIKITGVGAMQGSMEVQIDTFIAMDSSCGRETMACLGGGPSSVTFLPMPVF
jgi:uncharacterized protein (TIGR03437 family)